MARNLNRVQLIGALGRDPEVRRTQSGHPITNLRLATSESWKDKVSGEWKERTEWHSVVLHGEGLEKAAGALRKGSKVFVEGQLQTRKWADKDGVEKYSTEVVLQGMGGVVINLDAKAEGGGGRAEASTGASRSSTAGRGYDLGEDNDLPF